MLKREFSMTIDEAAEIQNLRHSFYTIWLVSPSGEKSYVNYTQRHSAVGLMRFVRKLASIPASRQYLEWLMGCNLDSLRFTKEGKSLIFTNGWKMIFGQTILQQASEREACHVE